MNGADNITAGKKIPGWFNDFSNRMPPMGNSRMEVHYNNPGDVLRFELSTKRAYQVMGYSKENVEIMTSISSCKVNDVIAQCEAMEAVGSIFLRIAELTVKLALLRLGLRFKFSMKQLRKINTVERELEILLASLYKQQRLILLMTRVQDAPGYDKSILRSRYCQLPLPFKRWRDTSEKGGEEELMFIPMIGMQHNFSNTKLTSICTMLTDYSAQSIPLWHLRRTG